MDSYIDSVTVIALSPLETAIFMVLVVALSFIMVRSIKTDFYGNIVGFDFSWLYILRRHRKNEGGKP